MKITDRFDIITYGNCFEQKRPPFNNNHRREETKVRTIGPAPMDLDTIDKNKKNLRKRSASRRLEPASFADSLATLPPNVPRRLLNPRGSWSCPKTLKVIKSNKKLCSISCESTPRPRFPKHSQKEPLVWTFSQYNKSPSLPTREGSSQLA